MNFLQRKNARSDVWQGADVDGQTYDIAVVGGGINGCGIARDAAGRGLSVMLVEQGDLASATSQWSRENSRWPKVISPRLVAPSPSPAPSPNALPLASLQMPSGRTSFTRRDSTKAILRWSKETLPQPFAASQSPN